MRRLLPLLLLALPALCWAADPGADASPKQGACVYARPATTAVADADVPQARPATPPAARSTPKPAASGGGGGGGGDSDTAVPRTRGHWHSFLPGMFR